MDRVFADRIEAARLLAARLASLRGQRPVIAGIPRGAVPMAAVIAEMLEGDLDVVLVHKVGHPQNPEFAIAAVDEEGHVFRYDGVGLTDAQLDVLAKPEVDRLRARRASYAALRPAVPLRDRIVVVVDDGLATGATMLAGVDSARRRGAKRVIAAAPVASDDAVALLEPVADEVVVLDVPRWFGSVGSFYQDFSPVSDREVAETLRKAPVRGAGDAPG